MHPEFWRFETATITKPTKTEGISSVFHTDPIEVSRKVNTLIKKGWELHGEPISHSMGGRTMIVQFMKKINTDASPQKHSNKQD